MKKLYSDLIEYFPQNFNDIPSIKKVEDDRKAECIGVEWESPSGIRNLLKNQLRHYVMQALFLYGDVPDRGSTSSTEYENKTKVYFSKPEFLTAFPVRANVNLAGESLYFTLNEKDIHEIPKG